MPPRLEALGIAAGLRRDAVHAQATAALDAVVHLVRDTSGHRRVAQLDVLTQTPTGWIEVRSALQVDKAGRVSEGPAREQLAKRLAQRGWTP